MRQKIQESTILAVAILASLFLQSCSGFAQRHFAAGYKIGKAEQSQVCKSEIAKLTGVAQKRIHDLSKERNLLERELSECRIERHELKQLEDNRK